MKTKTHLLNLPSEILVQILVACGSFGAFHLSQTCKTLWNFQGPTLYRLLFLSIYDSPALSSVPGANLDLSIYDWKSALEDRSFTETWIRSEVTTKKLISASTSDAVLERVSRTLVDIALSRPANIITPLDGEQVTFSKNQLFLEKYFPDNYLSPLFFVSLGKPRTKNMKAAERPAIILNYLSQFLCLASAQIYPGRSTSRAIATTVYHFTESARELVYDCTLFQRDSHWGPFIDDTHRVNQTLVPSWKKAAALALVMGKNMEQYSMDFFIRSIRRLNYTHGNDLGRPMGWQSTRTRRNPVGNPHDWAGVELGWMGTYAFLDYHTFHHFNFHRNAGSPLSLEGEIEALGEIQKLKFKIIPKEEMATFKLDMDEAQDSALDSESDAEPEPRLRSPPPSRFEAQFPTLYFKGNSMRYLHDHEIELPIRGKVSMLDDGTVKWNMCIATDLSAPTVAQWALHAVQIGGRRSQAGLVGAWSSTGHEEDGPNGPFMYWCCS